MIRSLLLIVLLSACQAPGADKGEVTVKRDLIINFCIERPS